MAEPNAAKSDGPFGSLERARDEIRKRKQAGGLPDGGATVWIAGGVYERNQAFELGPADSGTEKSPIVYRGQPGAEVRLIGGKRVTGFRPVSDPAVLQRLDPAARGKVLQANLKAHGITDYRPAERRRNRAVLPGPADDPGPLAQSRIRQDRRRFWGRRPWTCAAPRDAAEGVFTYEGDRPGRWAGEKDVWLHGYWFWDWADQRQQGRSDRCREAHRSRWPSRTTATGTAPGSGSTPSTCWRKSTSPASGTSTGETGILYFWPPAPIADGQADRVARADARAAPQTCRT